MRRGATVKHIFKIDRVFEDPEAVQVTYKQQNYLKLQKQLDDIKYEPVVIAENAEGDIELPISRVTVILEQQETMLFSTDGYALVQLRLISKNGDSYVSTIQKVKVEECLDCNILPLDPY